MVTCNIVTMDYNCVQRILNQIIINEMNKDYLGGNNLTYYLNNSCLLY